MLFFTLTERFNLHIKSLAVSLGHTIGLTLFYSMLYHTDAQQGRSNQCVNIIVALLFAIRLFSLEIYWIKQVWGVGWRIYFLLKTLNNTRHYYIIKMPLSDGDAVHLIRKCFNQKNLSTESLTGQQRTHQDEVEREQILARDCLRWIWKSRRDSLQEHEVK